MAFVHIFSMYTWVADPDGDDPDPTLKRNPGFGSSDDEDPAPQHNVLTMMDFDKSF